MLAPGIRLRRDDAEHEARHVLVHVQPLVDGLLSRRRNEWHVVIAADGRAH